MNQAAEILSELQRRGVIVAVEGDTLCLKPRRALDDTLLSRVREAKPAILEALRTCVAACGSSHCAGCYEVRPGVRIHPPKCGEGYRGVVGTLGGKRQSAMTERGKGDGVVGLCASA